VVFTTSVHAKRLGRLERKRNVLREMLRDLVLGTFFRGFGIDLTAWSRVLFEKPVVA
jgi:hypothetical protein